NRPGPLLPHVGAPSRVRLLGSHEALELLPPVWERALPEMPGMVSRSKPWWQYRRLWDGERARQGGGPLQQAAIEVDGRPEAYALYRHNMRWDGTIAAGVLHVVEAVGATSLGTCLVWRYLFDIDLMQRIEANLLPINHPLLLLVAEPRRLRMSM